MQRATKRTTRSTFRTLQGNVLHNLDILREVLSYRPSTKDWGRATQVSQSWGEVLGRYVHSYSIRIPTDTLWMLTPCLSHAHN